MLISKNYCTFDSGFSAQYSFKTKINLHISEKSSTFVSDFEKMKRVGYILLFLVSMGIQIFSPKSAPTAQSNTSTGCTVQQNIHGTLVGIQGEPLTIIGSTAQVQFSAPTHFSYSAQRVHFGKNRTRTAFLRRMIHHYQPVYLVFRGKERLETSPFSTHPGSTYYVYGLRRILC